MTTWTPLPAERVEVRRQRGDEGLALTGLHLGDVALVQRRATHDLHVEVTLAEGALGRLADRGERLGQQVVEALAVGQALPEDVGLVAQLLVGELLEVVLEGVDLDGDALQPLEDPALAGTHQLLEDLGHAELLLMDDLTTCFRGTRDITARARGTPT